jgi:hypothetical protein
MGFFRKYRIVWITLLFVALIVHCLSTSTKRIKGDGYEYLLMSQSFVNHATPDARIADVQVAWENVAKYSKFNANNDNIFSHYQQMIAGGTDGVYGYFKGLDNQYYSYHFWVYPLLNAPALWLTETLHWSPVRSFHITNLTIFILTLLFLTRTRILTSKQRYFITAFYIFCGTTYYVGWSHPEVFSGSFFLVGLILLLGRRYLIAGFLMALAAQQNPPIGIVAAGALGIQAVSVIALTFQNKLKKASCIEKLFLTGLVGCLLILSPIFYYLHFHATNLIVKTGSANSHLISFDRLHSFFLDLNQGMIVGIPFVMLLVGVLLIAYLCCPKLRQRTADTRKTILLALCMLAVAVIISIPALTTGNWNSGGSIFLRYVYWAAMPVGVAAMLLIGALPRRAYIITFMVFFIGQLWLLLEYKITGIEDYLVYKKPVTFLLENKADWYNPIPAIFVERGLHSEVGADQNTVYFYVNGAGEITKILYHQSNYAALSPCNGLSLKALANNITPVKTELGWFYINPPAGFCKSRMSSGFHKYCEY